MTPLPVLSPEQAAAWDRRAEEGGVALATLMDAAGRAAAAVVAARAAHRLDRGVLVAAGPGHNGGDGWVLARALARAGTRVAVAAAPAPFAPLTAQVRGLALADGVREVEPEGPWPAAGVAVDALLGTGARGAPRPPVASLLARLHDLEVPVFALDGPTGVDLATGLVHGAARADCTVTFGGLRRGHVLAREECGDVVVVDVGLPAPDPAWPQLVTDADAAQWQPRLRARDHKGDRGRVLVVGGAPGMTGAVRMAARAAFGAGTGLVFVATSAESADAIREADPDVQAFEQPLDAPLAPLVAEFAERADAVVVGPGLGRGAERTALVLAVLETAQAAVVDADALVLLARERDALRRQGERIPIVLTPHPGEFSALFAEYAGDRETDPWGAAARAAAAAGCTVLLKGVPTVVVAPGAAPLTVAAGNPGLATGGSGDVLSGLVASALARGLPPAQAAALGAQVLGRAADLAARRVTARAMRPLDVVAALPDLWREWDALRVAPPPPRPPVLLELPAPIVR